MDLLKLIVKKKKLQKLSGSLVLIIPELWIRSMDWSQMTKFILEFRPYNKQIIITENGEKVDSPESV